MTPSAAKLPSPSKNRSDLDAVVRRVADAAEEFARLPLPERIALAEKILAGCVATAEGQVRAACQAKGLDFDSAASAEEWLGGPYLTIRNVRLLIETMGRLESGQPPIDPKRIRTRGSRTIVDVFPTGAVDRITYAGFGGEVWMLPGVKPRDVIERAASHYREPLDRRRGRVALVLGAGNVASIGAMDVLHKLFVEGHVCVLKMNEVNAAYDQIKNGNIPQQPFGPDGQNYQQYGGAYNWGSWADWGGSWRRRSRRRWSAATWPWSGAAPRWAPTSSSTHRSTRSTSPAPTGPTTPSSGARPARSARRAASAAARC